MRVILNSPYKSVRAGVSFELPDFAMITGRNGSGKSHLLEAMSRRDVSTIDHASRPLARVQLVAFGMLNPQMDELCDPQGLAQVARGWWNQIDSVQQQVRAHEAAGRTSVDPLVLMSQNYGQGSPVCAVASSLVTRVGRPLMELTEDDVIFYSAFADGGQDAMFSSNLASIFKSYHNRSIRNSFNAFMNERRGGNYRVLGDVEFVAKFGPKPWDLVNGILERAGLSYRVLSPENQESDSIYKLKFSDETRGISISANDLSTGEKVLMSLAVGIYNTHESVGKPDVLLLDEPDAPLHPQYSKLLIETLREVIVDMAGVKVVMTTHSPSTVAMCGDNELFEMDRADGIPKMISVGRGLEVLTQGIPHLRVSIDNRRQIFVESKYDVEYYQLMFNALRRLRPIGYEPIFLEPHSGTSNCSDVVAIVQGLYGSGGDLVRGIVDWDLERTSSHPVYVLGEGCRYSVENYILDPIFVALALIRAGRWTFVDCGCPHLTSYVSARDMTEEDYAVIVSAVLNKVGITTDDVIAAELMNGWDVKLPRRFLELRGHDWESALLEKIPEMNSVVVRNRGEAGLKLGVLAIVSEYPQFLSVDVWNTLNRLT